MPDLELFRKKSLDKKEENKAFYHKLKRLKPKNLDDTIHNLHHQEFETTDCLACANCCKTTSPIFYNNDIERVAKALKMKPSAFVEEYLTIDEDKDYVLKSSPCPFLDGENYCMVYKDRPTACREYPHTNRKRMVQILDLTYRNTLVCPAVLNITTRLKEIF